ncbi:hypothetical protein ACQP1O_42770 (plasmid) [Nocardia sp. CA-151230]|uniref:hypothetical protein n=1 Tax=Nocardia sp. CA-151230 TaxID=3239982 RepID=UPI003D913170
MNPATPGMPYSPQNAAPVNPFDQSPATQPYMINTAPLVINGQPIQLPPTVQPVYVVRVPMDQIATAVMRGIIRATIFLALIGFVLGIVIMVAINH